MTDKQRIRFEELGYLFIPADEEETLEFIEAYKKAKAEGKKFVEVDDEGLIFTIFSNDDDVDLYLCHINGDPLATIDVVTDDYAVNLCVYLNDPEFKVSTGPDYYSLPTLVSAFTLISQHEEKIKEAVQILREVLKS